MKIVVFLCLIAWLGLALGAASPSMHGSIPRYVVYWLAVGSMVAAGFAWRSTVGAEHKAKKLTPVRFSINAILAGVIMTVAVSAIADLMRMS